ncbi:MAG TPA: PilW family protein [Thauera sp.]|nr:PilW family protein [Thauera sp.]
MQVRISQRGMSIVELMIAMVIGLIVLGGVSQIFLSSRATHRNTQAMSEVQEGGRFAFDFIAADLRQVGYRGSCTEGVNNLLNESGASYNAARFDMNNPITGWDSWADMPGNDDDLLEVQTARYVAGTHVIGLKQSGAPAMCAAPNQMEMIRAAGDTSESSPTISIDCASDIADGTLMMVADAQGCDVFQTRPSGSTTLLSRAIGGNPGNKNPSTNNFSHPYAADMEILRVQSAVYYIGRETANARPGLRRILFNQGGDILDQELVQGVSDMRLEYGIDTDGDREVDRYEEKAIDVPNWRNVLSIRVSLTTQSNETGITGEDDAFRDQEGERRLEQVFTSTIALRNRLP